MLPTDKADGHVIFNRNGLLTCHKGTFTQEYLRHIGATSHYLYITTDDEIKEGDWYILKRNGFPLTIEIAMNEFEIGNLLGDEEKIISTTDTKLKLPQPSKDFIESYCKNPVEKVMVEYIGTCTNCGEQHEDSVLCMSMQNAEYDARVAPYTIKLTSNNEIIIHSIKNSWNREEVEKLIKRAYSSGYGDGENHIDFDNGKGAEIFIKENLQ